MQVGYYWFNHQTKLGCNSVEMKSCSKLQRTLIIIMVNRLYLYLEMCPWSYNRKKQIFI